MNKITEAIIISLLFISVTLIGCAGGGGGGSDSTDPIAGSPAEPSPENLNAPTKLNTTELLSDQVSLTWVDNSEEETGFVIERGSDPLTYKEVQRVSSNKTSYTDKGLIPDTSYYYRIKSYNSTTDSDYSNSLEIITEPKYTASELCLAEQVIHISKTGTDDPNCGDANSSCKTIKYGLGLAESGDNVCVHEGKYDENWLTMKSNVWLLSADGQLKAKIFSAGSKAVHFYNISNSGIDGFEIYGLWNEGSPGDGLIRVLDASNITIRNVMAHDAPYDTDIIKVSGNVSNLLIDGIVAWNPGVRTDNTNYQELIDICGCVVPDPDKSPISNITVRGSWLFHIDGKGDWLIYSKINAENILYENNIFGPSAGNGYGNAAVGIGTGEDGRPVKTAAVVNHAIVRNNIFTGLKGDAAFTIMNADDTWVYNNTFYNNSGPDLRSVIMLRGNNHEIESAYIFNNIFVDNNPAKYSGTFFWNRNNLPTEWQLDYNLYSSNISSSDIDYSKEINGVYNTAPELLSPAIPYTSNPSLARIAEIKNDFAISNSSVVIDKGLDVIAKSGHPNWNPGVTDKRWDFDKEERPTGTVWDIGADEIQE